MRQPDLTQNERDACRKLALDLAEAAEKRSILQRGMFRDYQSAHEGFAAGCRAVAAAIEARNKTLNRR